MARPFLRRVRRRLHRRQPPLLGVVGRTRGAGQGRALGGDARPPRRRSLLGLLHHRPVPARPPLQRSRRQGRGAREECDLTARRRRWARRVLDGALPPQPGPAGDDRRPSRQRPHRPRDSGRSRHGGAGQLPRERHVRSRPRRPPRRSPLLQHRPPPLAGVGAEALRAGRRGAASSISSTASRASNPTPAACSASSSTSPRARTPIPPTR
jgi:hypothetical protein